MTNEELLEQISNGDDAALAKLSLMNTGLVKDRARLIARQYHCLRQTKYGGLSDYTKETLSELESVGKLALVECVRAGGYDAEKGRFTTYVTPFLDGAMRRHLECSMGTLALDRDSMGLVRKAQRLYYQEGKEPSEICASLGISLRAVARAITYPTHFFSVYDLQGPDDDGDIFERLASTRLSGSAEDAVIRMVTMECLREEFLRLSKRDRDILGRYFGVYGFPKADLQEIAVRNLLKESGVEKAKDQAIKRLQDRCQSSLAWKLRRARRMMELVVPQR
ncbi:MAG: sigma-70 family RNA polymerase sigma factor [Faecalispora jeddahensis]|jgi:DNA-directed RNA polymerase specialized sigma subunit